MAITSRPCSSACWAVIKDPERSAACTTSTASDKPEMMRLRRGKWCGKGGVPKGYSLMSAPPLSQMRLAKST